MAKNFNIVIQITDKYTDQPAGQIVSQSVEAGKPYKDGNAIQLVFSLGNQIIIPSFTGKTADAAQTWVTTQNNEGAKLTLKITSTQSNSPLNTILSQDKMNVAVTTDATISITVSLGNIIHVPDFVAPSGSGYDAAITREKALAMCQQLNIVPVFVESKKSGRVPGEVWSQSIKAGTEVAQGTTITLNFNPNTSVITIPDFKGITEEDIISKYNKKLTLVFVIETSYVDGYSNTAYQQSLTAGTKVAAGSTITINISPSASTTTPSPSPSPSPSLT